MTREEALATISKGIKAFRQRKGLTQEELGQILGNKKANISQMERAVSAPSIDGIFTLIEHGMTAEELFGKELAARMAANSEPPSPMEKALLVRQGLKELLGMLDRE